MKRFYILLASLLFFVCFFCFYGEGPLAHVLYYQEQHHLFLFSKAYGLHQIQTNGIIAYIADFLIQFFYYPVIGSSLMALLLVSMSLLTRIILQRITGKEDVLQLSLIPSIYFLICFTSVEYPVATLVKCLLALLFFTLIVSFSIPFWKFFTWLPNANHLHIKYKYLISTIAVILYAGGGFYFFLKSYNNGERIMVLSEKFVKEKDWNKVLSLTQRYQQHRLGNQLIAYFHHLALYHNGRLAYDLFETPQMLGVKSLYFPWESNSRESEYGHYFYEELGSINEAHRWEFEAMVVWGETAPHLCNLIRYNIVNHRPLVAQRFINVLKQSLFYRDQALAFEQMIPEAKVPGLTPIPVDETKPARFANVFNIGPDLQYICERSPRNRMAFEYLMSDLLLSNQLVRFAENLPRIRAFSYAEMPRIYEEALYIYKIGVAPETFRKVGLDVGTDTQHRFERYYTLYKQGNRAALEREFGNTYWYYLHFISPYGSKIIQ
ncbi:MAG: DUF6057 family protein [Bacteroides sp.]|uniref:DUF6057 family protein n=1 Tax=Bacteroides sp. TaxID=29523 RepID=UPI002FC6378E